MSPKDILTIREAAEHLRVSERTLKRHLAAGHIQVLKVGRLVRIRKSDLDAAFAFPRPRKPRMKVSRGFAGGAAEAGPCPAASAEAEPGGWQGLIARQ